MAAAGSPEAFFWYDCFAIDQHECQYPDPAKPKKSSEWWSSKFVQAIGSIGSTVMMMSPWDAPTPLRRSWYLWELYCTVATGSELSICLGPAEEAALEAALLADPKALLKSFASIDVPNAEAGGREDQERILAAVRALPGGASGLNSLAMERMREFLRQKARAMVSALREAEVEGGGLVREEGSLDMHQLTRLLDQLGDTVDALYLFEEVIEGMTAQLGASHRKPLTTKGNLAGLMTASAGRVRRSSSMRRSSRE